MYHLPRYERAQVATLVDRLRRKPPERIFALFGPRQSGKTTIVDQALARLRGETKRETLYCAADAPDAPGGGREATSSPRGTLPEPLGADWVVRRWNEARVRAERSGGCVLVFDEIQEIPLWSTVVKGLWDEDRGLHPRPHVVILGSAPLSVQSGLAESLAGRFAPLPVHHWSFREMAEAFGFDLQRYLYFGSYPGAAGLAVEGAEDEWRMVVLDGCLRPTIERDILALTRVDKPALMKRLFEMSAEYSGQIVSFTKLVGHLQDAGNTTTLARYLDLLEAAGLVAGLSGYTTQSLHRRSSPKLLALNPALLTSVSRFNFRDALADRSFWGRVVESAVGAHLFQTRSPSTRLYYWRYKNAEVDLVLEQGRHLLAIEVKSGPYRGAHTGLAAFRAKYRHARPLLVGEGGVPITEFLSEPAEHWLTWKRD